MKRSVTAGFMDLGCRSHTSFGKKKFTQVGYQGERRTVPTLKSAPVVTSGRKYTKARAGQESGERRGDWTAGR